MNRTPRALYDLSVLMDALNGDPSPTPESSAALSLAAKGRVTGYICATAVDCLNDLLTRSHGAPIARSRLAELRAMLEIARVDAEVVDAAIALDWDYLDDALTHECARLNGLDYLITLNPGDFPNPAIAVRDPSELLQTVKAA